jgi:hypothetical protein
MKEKFNEIVEILEKADQIFKDCAVPEEARNLWNAGIERLAAAIWLWERGNEMEDVQQTPAKDIRRL